MQNYREILKNKTRVNAFFSAHIITFFTLMSRLIVFHVFKSFKPRLDTISAKTAKLSSKQV